jgi:hypothetical protein
MRRKLMALVAVAALGSVLASGCEKKTVTTTTDTKTTESSAAAPTPATTPMMGETPVAPAVTPTP